MKSFKRYRSLSLILRRVLRQGTVTRGITRVVRFGRSKRGRPDPVEPARAPGARKVTQPGQSADSRMPCYRDESGDIHVLL
jgi:hypothetical protein